MSKIDEERNPMTSKEFRKSLMYDEYKARAFMKKFYYEDLSYKELFEIYKRNIWSPHFNKTNMSAFVLVFLPGFTNIYYTFRPNSLLSNVMSFGMPIVCLSVYIYHFLTDMKKFIKDELSQDSQKALYQFKYIYYERPEGIHFERWLDEVSEKRKYKIKYIYINAAERVRLQLESNPLPAEKKEEPAAPADLRLLARRYHCNYLFYRRYDEPYP